MQSSSGGGCKYLCRIPHLIIKVLHPDLTRWSGSDDQEMRRELSHGKLGRNNQRYSFAFIPNWDNQAILTTSNWSLFQLKRSKSLKRNYARPVVIAVWFLLQFSLKTLVGGTHWCGAISREKARLPLRVGYIILSSQLYIFLTFVIK